MQEDGVKYHMLNALFELWKGVLVVKNRVFFREITAASKIPAHGADPKKISEQFRSISAPAKEIDRRGYVLIENELWGSDYIVRPEKLAEFELEFGITEEHIWKTWATIEDINV